MSVGRIVDEWYAADLDARRVDGSACVVDVEWVVELQRQWQRFGRWFGVFGWCIVDIELEACVADGLLVGVDWGPVGVCGAAGAAVCRGGVEYEHCGVANECDVDGGVFGARRRFVVLEWGECDIVAGALGSDDVSCDVIWCVVCAGVECDDGGWICVVDCTVCVDE